MAMRRPSPTGQGSDSTANAPASFPWPPAARHGLLAGAWARNLVSAPATSSGLKTTCRPSRQFAGLPTTDWCGLVPTNRPHLHRLLDVCLSVGQDGHIAVSVQW